jgi:hypothetical protein
MRGRLSIIAIAAGLMVACSEPRPGESPASGSLTPAAPSAVAASGAGAAMPSARPNGGRMSSSVREAWFSSRLTLKREHQRRSEMPRVEI